MRWIVRALAAGLVLAAGMGNAQQAPPRLALVIGNAAYAESGWGLKNPVNDATLIAARLRPLGFEVQQVSNANKAQMEAAMRGFAQRLRAGGAEAIGLFYYAGHAVESDGANLLIPTDVAATSVDDLRYEAPPLSLVLRGMAQAGNRVNIVILDACRSLPLASGTREGAAGGLSALDDVPTNILLAYATRAGATAPDNPQETNSLFSKTLADALASNAGDPLSLLFESVQARVAAATAFQQRPEFKNQLLRAPGFRLAATSATASTDPELERLRRENAALREAEAAKQRASANGAGAPSPPAVSAPAVAAPRPDAGGGARAPGSIFRDCADCPEMVVIPAGSFTMGDDASGNTDERPAHRVTLARNYALSRTEVTRGQWAAFVADTGWPGPPSNCHTLTGQNGSWRNPGFSQGDDHPVVCVSWEDVRAYARWLGGRTGANYRLPTEAEWEYAARARSTSTYHFGSSDADACSYGNVADATAKRSQSSWTVAACDDGYYTTAPVGRFPGNDFGLRDIVGNVWEWTEDCYVNSYNSAPSDGHTAVTTGGCANRVLRGGSWNVAPARARSANRNYYAPANRSSSVGFRLARTL